ncbi:MAG: hypothetical protein PHU34_03660 [Candidatus Methanoperedens sp.]|nr:hypothetical protein [Candidatus Methanoperedens sp.]
MMTLSDLLKNTGYAIVFGFMGIIIGIWTADVLYMIILKNLERLTTTYISLIIIILIIVSASLLGFVKGKKLLE